MTTMASDENVALVTRQFETLSLEESKVINKRSRNNNSTKKRDFIPRLPLELVNDIMKYFEPHILIEMLSVSKEWENCLLGCPPLWSSWHIYSSDYNWYDPRVLRVLTRVGRYILELRLDYSTDLKNFTRALLNHISKGDLKKLESLEFYNCYWSHSIVFQIPKNVLLTVANTLKKLEISYFGRYGHTDETRQQGSSDNYIFMAEQSDSTPLNPFKSIMTIISTCHQLEYLRYVNPYSFERFSSLPLSSSSSLSVISTITNNNSSSCLSLKHLEIEVGDTKASYMEHILKQCPNLRIFRLKYRWDIDTPILDSIRRYCPYLEYLSFDSNQDPMYGKKLYDWYYSNGSGRNHSHSTTAKLTSASRSLSQPALKTLYISVQRTSHVIPLLKRYFDTIEELGLSFKRGSQVDFSSIQPMKHLVTLVMTYAGHSSVLATLISNAPSLRNLELYETPLMSTELTDILKRLNTLEKLKIHNKPAQMDDMNGGLFLYACITRDLMVDVFNTYAEASMFAAAVTSGKEGEKNACDRDLSQRQRHDQGALTHVSLSGCVLIHDSVLEALGNIKTLSHVSIESAPLVTTKGINAFCKQLNLLPELSCIDLSDLRCVDDSTLSILGSSSISATSRHGITRTITLKSLDNITKEGLNQLVEKQGISVILR